MNKQKIILLAIYAFLVKDAYLQEYKTLREHDNAKIDAYNLKIEESSTIKFNYLLSDEEIKTFNRTHNYDETNREKLSKKITIKEVTLKDRISPRNGILYSYIEYSIKNEQNKLVYQTEINSKMDNPYELFITEYNMYSIAVPRFEWDGSPNVVLDSEYLNTDYVNSEDPNEKKVKDGMYKLCVKIKNYSKDDEEAARNEKAIIEMHEIPIIIDTTPPRIDFQILNVYNNEKKESYYLLCPLNEYSENIYWKITINGKERYSKQSYCPIIPIYNANKNDLIEITAEDNHGNVAKTETFIGEKIAKSAYKDKDQFSYINAIASTLSNKKIIVSNSDHPVQKYQIPNKYVDKIKEYQSDSPVYLYFGQNQNGIPLDIQDEYISFSINNTEIQQNTYPLYLSTNDFSNLIYIGDYRVQNKFPYIDLKLTAKNIQITDSRENKTDVLTCSFVPLSLENSNLEWKIELFNSKGEFIALLNSGTGFVDGENGVCTWNGFNQDGEFIYSSFENYSIVLTFENNVSYKKNTGNRIVSDIGFDGHKYIKLPDIIFPSNIESFIEDSDLYNENLPVLEAIVKTIQDNREDIMYIEILGYANPQATPKDKKTLQKENETYLIPLSQKRADYIKKLLILKGVPTELLKTIPCGGIPYEADPFNKKENWKNRRVRFNVVTK